MIRRYYRQREWCRERTKLSANLRQDIRVLSSLHQHLSYNLTQVSSYNRNVDLLTQAFDFNFNSGDHLLVSYSPTQCWLAACWRNDHSIFGLRSYSQLSAYLSMSESACLPYITHEVIIDVRSHSCCHLNGQWSVQCTQCYAAYLQLGSMCAPQQWKPGGAM